MTETYAGHPKQIFHGREWFQVRGNQRHVWHALSCDRNGMALVEVIRVQVFNKTPKRACSRCVKYGRN